VRAPYNTASEADEVEPVAAYARWMGRDTQRGKELRRAPAERLATTLHRNRDPVSLRTAK
jgi:hypothetical protein